MTAGGVGMCHVKSDCRQGGNNNSKITEHLESTSHVLHHLILITPYKICAIIIPTSQMRMLKHKDWISSLKGHNSVAEPGFEPRKSDQEFTFLSPTWHFLEGLWREMFVELDSVQGKHKDLHLSGKRWNLFERKIQMCSRYS